ncbi:MAG: DUF4149 domain-containing protein [Planctomycetes bacterium]|nr:DUF4149 domain-containing protein [Planctomycetota bacterium]
MPAMKLPPFLTQYAKWIEANPALGAISVLALIVVLLWLLRKSLKLFMVLIGVAAIALLASYFIVGPEKTNNAVREKTHEAIEQGKDLLEKGRQRVEEEFENSGKTYLNGDSAEEEQAPPPDQDDAGQ